MNKKYKRLDDVYLNNTFGKVVKPVVGMPENYMAFFKEYAEVLIQKDPPKGEVKDYKVSDDTAKKLSQALDVKEPNQQVIVSYLNQKGYSTNSFKGKGFDVIVDTVLENNEQDVASFTNFIKGTEKPKLLNNLSGNLKDIGQKYNLSPNIIQSLATLSLLDNTSNAVGPGEIAIGVLFEDIKNSSTTGDLELNGKKVEVKGSGGRMGLQPGRSPQTVDSLIFVEPFLKNKETIDNYKNIVLNSKYGQSVREKANDLIYNLVVSYNFVSDKNAVYEHIVKKLDELYGYGARHAREYITKPLLQSADYNAIKKAMFKLYARGYLEKNKIDGYLINVNNNLDYIVITLEQLLESGTGYIDTGKLVVSNFRFKNLYPSINIGKI